MFKVSSLEALSLRVVADFAWDLLTPLEPTLGLKLTNLMNGLDDCSCHARFLNRIKMIPLAHENVFNTKLLVNSLWNNFKMNPPNFVTTLKHLNEYLSLPITLKSELSHVLSTQYDSCNVFHMLLMIEMGLPCLDFEHYLQLSGDLRFIDLLKFGKKSIQKLVLSTWWHKTSFTSIQTQEFLMTSIPYLQELIAVGTCCNDDTLRLVAKYCMHLKKLTVRSADGVTDEGIKFLCSPESAAKQLVYLNLYHTEVTAKGAEIALKFLARLETLECSNEIDTFSLFKSLLEQELVFVGVKEISIRFLVKTEEGCKDLIHKLPLIFPNLCHVTFSTNVTIQPEDVLALQSLPKISHLSLKYFLDSSASLFPCDYRTNFQVQMNNLTHLTLKRLWNVCIHSVIGSTPSLKCLHIQQVLYSSCTHANTVNIYSSVSHLVLTHSGEAVVGKILGLCPRIKSLAWLDNHEMQFRINSANLTNLTHLCLDRLQMETAECLVENCKNLRVLNFVDQYRVSEEAVKWLKRHSPFLKVMYSGITYPYTSTWFEDEKFSPCCLCQVYESYI